MVDEVGARLVVQDRLRFSRDMRASSEDVERLGRETGQVAARATTASRALGVMSRTGRGVGRTMAGAVAPSRSLALSLGIGAGGLAFAARRGWQELQELNKVEQLTKAHLKSTGHEANVSAKHIRQRSINLESLTSIDENLIGSGQNLLLTFRNIRNEAGRGNKIFDRTTMAALNLSQEFGSVGSASKMLGKALNDPVLGMTAMSRAGVTFSQQQKDSVAKMVEANDMLGAQKLILREVEAQVGGSAKAYGDSIEGMGNRITDGFGDISRGLVTGLVPIVEKYATPFTKWLGNVSDIIDKRGWKAAWREVVPSELRDNVGSIAGAISGALVPAITAFTIKIGIASVKLAPFLLFGSALADMLGVNVEKSDQLSKSMKDRLGPGLGTATEKLSALMREVNEMGPGGKTAAGLGLIMAPTMLRGAAGMVTGRRGSSVASSVAGTAGGAAAPGLLARGAGWLRANPRVAAGAAGVAMLGGLALRWKHLREEQDKAAMSAERYIELYGLKAARQAGVATTFQGQVGIFTNDGMSSKTLGTIQELNESHKDYIDRLTGSRRATLLLQNITRDADDLNKRQIRTLGGLIGTLDDLGGRLSKHEQQTLNIKLISDDWGGALAFLNDELREHTRWLKNALTGTEALAEAQADLDQRRTGGSTRPAPSGGRGGRGRNGGGDGTTTTPPPAQRTKPVVIELNGREVGRALVDLMADGEARG